jgi:N-methylhydantoinase A
VGFVVHGTTVATNAIIEGKAGSAGLLTSDGFRDVLEIGYQTRPSLYDVFYDKPEPLVPRYRCLGIPERLGPDGEILQALDEEAVRLAARSLKAEGVEAIAVAFLHSYRNPEHEQRAGEILRQECPDIPVVLSSDVCPEFREYPRTSTAVVNAVLMPRISPYVRRFVDGFVERGVRRQLYLMTSSGGIITADVAKDYPVRLIESGPAAGVIGAAFVAHLAGFDHVLALDIGGTTAKAAIISGGEPQISDQFEVGAQAVASVTAHRGQGYPVRTPAISLLEIGAGGGSIAHVDYGGALTVGPQSAGADPGPVCYGQGGTRPTLTDANLVLGRINPEYFLGGEQSLNKDNARRAIKEQLADPLGMKIVDAALSVVEIANAKMISALYFISVQQGVDPRDHVLVASGGAGPMQAAAIAQGLEVRQVLIPPAPGLNSAVGLLSADLKHEVVRTYMKPASSADEQEMRAALSQMRADLHRLLSAEGVSEERITGSSIIETLYVGQSYPLKVEVDLDIETSLIDQATAGFRAMHRAAYGFADPDEPVQFVNLRQLVVGSVNRPRLRELQRSTQSVENAEKSTRDVYFGQPYGWVDARIYDREQLRWGDAIEGPAIIEQMDTTTVLPPATVAKVDQIGNLLIDVPVTRPADQGEA